MNNPIRDLADRLRARFPEATVTLDPPAQKDGDWFCDVSHHGHEAVVVWRRGRSIGVSAGSDAAYGDGPDEVLSDVELAYHRLVALILSGGRTHPPAPSTLSGLRHELGLSQQELAKRQRRSQAALSKLENRSDLRVSTLAEAIGSLGGELKLQAVFPDGRTRELVLRKEEA